MKKQIYIINGTGGSGKDTVVSMVDEDYYTMNIDSVAIVKEVATQLGWDGTKTEENRLFLSNLKALADRHFNHSTKYVIKQIEVFLNSKAEFAFIHIREPQLIEKIVNWCNATKVGCNTVLVINSRVDEITTNNSDKNVANYSYDIHIENNGSLDDLRLEVLKKLYSERCSNE